MARAASHTGRFLCVHSCGQLLLGQLCALCGRDSVPQPVSPVRGDRAEQMCLLLRGALLWLLRCLQVSETLLLPSGPSATGPQARRPFLWPQVELSLPWGPERRCSADRETVYKEGGDFAQRVLPSPLLQPGSKQSSAVAAWSLQRTVNLALTLCHPGFCLLTSVLSHGRTGGLKECYHETAASPRLPAGQDGGLSGLMLVYPTWAPPSCIPPKAWRQRALPDGLPVPFCLHAEADTDSTPALPPASGTQAVLPREASLPLYWPGLTCPLSLGRKNHMAKDTETLSSGVQASNFSFMEKDKVLPSRFLRRTVGASGQYLSPSSSDSTWRGPLLPSQSGCSTAPEPCPRGAAPMKKALF